MHPSQEAVQELASWFIAEMREITSRELGEQCELLLCASDLGLNTPRIRRLIAAIETAEPDPAIQDQRLLDAVRRQLVYFRFGAAIESRKRFLDYWFHNRHFKGKDVFSVSLFVNLALEQQELLTEHDRKYAQVWYLRHPEINALRVRAWAPHCLNLGGFADEAKARAAQVVDAMQPDGSWDHDVRRTLGTVYPLCLSGHVSSDVLSASIDYSMVRITRGFADEVGIKSAALKSIAKLGWAPGDLLNDLRNQIGLHGGVFLSHTTADKPIVRRLADDLRAAGVRVWIDEAEIRAGDSLLRTIESGIADMECLAVILSPRSVASTWVQKELDMGLISALSDRSIRVIPVLIETCSVPLRLRDLRWVDFRSDYSRALADLLGSIGAV